MPVSSRTATSESARSTKFKPIRALLRGENHRSRTEAEVLAWPREPQLQTAVIPRSRHFGLVLGRYPLARTSNPLAGAPAADVVLDLPPRPRSELVAGGRAPDQPPNQPTAAECE